MTQLVIRQRKSAIGEKDAAKRTLQTLGLRRTGQEVERADSKVVRGMLRRVAHLVDVSTAEAPRRTRDIEQEKA